MSTTTNISRLEWSFNQSLEMVGEIKSDTLKFSLLKNKTVLSSDTLPVSELGVCVQQWMHRDLNVRMFSAQNRRVTYMIATDIANETFNAFLEPKSLSENNWKARINNMDPDISKAHYFLFLIPVAASISWDTEKPRLESPWKRSNEKSEIGISRYWTYLGTEYRSKVKYAFHVNCGNNGNNLWERTQIKETTVENVTRLSAEILELLTQVAGSVQIPHIDDLDYAEQDAFYQILQGQAVTYGLSSLNPTTRVRSLAFYQPLETDMFLEFMPNRNLEQVSSQEISSYINTECLNSTNKFGEAPFVITQGNYTFRDGITLPALSLTMSRGGFIKFLGWFNAWVPGITAAGKAANEADKIKIRNELILSSILRHPSQEYADLTRQQIVELSIAELDKAYKGKADIALHLSLNRAQAEIFIDQTMYWGTQFRLNQKVRAEAPAITAANLA